MSLDIYGKGWVNFLEHAPEEKQYKSETKCNQ